MRNQTAIPKILKAVSPKVLKMAAVRGEIEIDQELAAIEETLEIRLAQIKRKSHIAWPGFPTRLIAHGEALIGQGKRMRELSPMPTEDRPLRKFNSPQEWRQNLKKEQNVLQTDH